MKTPERLETPSNQPHQKNDCQGEWNAIRQSFSQMLLEKVSLQTQAREESSELML